MVGYAAMDAVAVLDDPRDAAVALDPVRSRVLGVLSENAASAAGVAERLGLPRQRVGYHLRALEERGLVVEVSRRKHGGLTERLFSSSAASYVVSPAAFGGVGASPERVADRLSAAYAVAVAARVVDEVGRLVRAASKAGRRLPTMSVTADVRFRSAADRAAFADELGAAVRDLGRKYHDESAPAGRWCRVTAIVHPRPPKES